MDGEPAGTQIKRLALYEVNDTLLQFDASQILWGTLVSLNSGKGRTKKDWARLETCRIFISVLRNPVIIARVMQ